MPLQATSGAASYDAFGGGAAAVPIFIEDLFSTYLYTGNGATQTITNGIDLSTKGGLVWCKGRNYVEYHGLFDTARGRTKGLYSNDTAAEANTADTIGSFNSNGFSLGSDSWINTNTKLITSWTFREQPKFFDVVTYTGNGTAGRTVAHNLGSVPGCIIVKRTDAANGWPVYHRSMNASPQNYQMRLNATTEAFTSSPSRWNDTLPTSTEFTLSANDEVNGSGATYVAYLFAHDAGGFGLTGTDNVISCGSFTSDGSGIATVTLGYEPQFVMIKRTDGTSNWTMLDNMRGWAVTSSGDAALQANTSNAETSGTEWGYPTSTGFSVNEPFGSTNWIYIAIRRGPMKVPTSGTSVFELQNLDNLSVNTLVSSAVVPDMALQVNNLGARYVVSRLTGGINTASSSSTSPRNWLVTSDTSAEDTTTTGLYYEMQNASFRLAGNGADPGSSFNLAYFMRRAPSFFDVVCYTGTGSATTQAHNLGVAPELMIVKMRSTAGYSWCVYASSLGANYVSFLNLTSEFFSGAAQWNSTNPTSSVFSLSSNAAVNNSGDTFVAYLFATCAGVSKCTAFTGTGTLQTIDCGFTSGARFVLVKRTDSTGDWYIWDSSRGLSSSTDPYLLLNSTAAEVTSTNWVDTTATGFQVTAASGNNVNINGASYIALAIA